ncbi:hypothetical protein Pint_23510 [Pistacia integerrima]|uniref:Uncharacterized protein n=1 Tax=Pistacia integerrima TaxID=434235 RepID=A0ACC0YK55_9ROSI|nr:hypothetical protein Pint_23510 [Pistacia integerrima]
MQQHKRFNIKLHQHTFTYQMGNAIGYVTPDEEDNGVPKKASKNHQINGRSISISKSHSNVYAHLGSKKQRFKRSSSSSQLSIKDLFLTPQQLVSQELKMESLETNHFVLVHGGGFGVWCWYKTMTLLEETGFKVDVIDLAGSGANSCDINTITSLEQNVKPLIEFCNKLGNEEKV